MKKVLQKISMLFLLLSNIIVVYAQFYSINSGTSNNLYDVSFTDENTGYIVGYQGIIRKTIDGGLTWNNLNSGVSNYLKSVCFINDSIGFAVGIGGIILKTEDRGTTWNSQSLGTNYSLLDVYFENVDTGYIVGTGGIILKTVNGGDYWFSQTSNLNYDLVSVFFIDSNNGYIVGDNGNILKTTNGGVNWVLHSLNSSYDFKCVYFLDVNYGYIVGSSGLILKTTNGGITWYLQNSSTTSNLNSICFKDSIIGYAVGDGGLILRTKNGGLNWGAIYSGDNKNLTSVYFSEENIGYIVGFYGTLYRTYNGGESYDTLFSESDKDFNSVYFCDANNGYIVGNYGSILKTTNGGQNWALHSLLPSNHLSCVYFSDINNGYIVGSSGKILKTTNGGTDWISQTSGTTKNLNSVFFIDSNYGYAVGDSGAILKTINGGTDWILQTSGTIKHLYSICALDSNYCYAIGGYGTILKTINGGQIWTPQTSQTTYDLNSIYFTDINTGFVVGNNGKILKTINGGTNWILQAAGTSLSLHSVYFLDSNFGYAVGDGSLVLRTTNSGIDWDIVFLESTNRLKSVFFTTNNTGYAVGYDGLIYRKAICSGIPGDIIGSNSFCNPSGNSIYTSNVAPFASSYLWSINPPEAGTISDTGVTANISWSNTYNGIASLKIQGVKEGCIGEWSKKNVVISNGNLGSFNLSLPTNGTWVNTTPTFKWTSSLGSLKYSLYIDGILKKDSIFEPFYKIQSYEALSSGIHTWYVKSNSGCVIQSGETRSFLVDSIPPSNFNLLSPTNNTWTSNSLTTFTWTPSIDAQSGLKKYQLWIDGVLNRDSIPITNTNSTPIRNLINGSHTWEIKAFDNVGIVKNSSQIGTFNIDNIPPGNESGSSLYFNGVNDYVEIPNDSVFNLNYNFSIEAWVKLLPIINTSDDVQPTIISKDNGYYTQERSWFLKYDVTWNNSAQLAFFIAGIGTLSSTTPLNTDSYNHIVITINRIQNKTIVKMYINGVVTASADYYGIVPLSTANILLSKKPGSNNYDTYPFHGYIDEVRIWNSVRTPEQIEEFKNVALNSNTPNLIGYWRFNEGSGNTAYDMSIHDNNGSINGPIYQSSTIEPSVSLTNLLNPVNNQFILPTNQNFLWTSSYDTGVGFKKYQLWIDNNLVMDNLIDTTCTVLNSLTYGKHIWNIKGYDSLNNYQDSYYVNFYVDNVPPNPFHLVAPINNEVVMFPTPDLSWQATTDSIDGCGLSKYQLWINGQINRDSISINTTTVSPATVLPQGAYSWYVKAYDKLGNYRQSSETRIFYVDWEFPSVFNLIAPYDNEILNISNPTFSWYPSSDIGSGIAYYEITISGNQPIVVPSTDTNYQLTFHLPNGYYSWFVKAYDYSGAFISSNTNSFTINESLPEQASIPTGNNEICQNTQSTTYTTSGANYASTYLWNISPSNAGTISGNGLTATVTWNNSFTGAAQITVTGQNLVGAGIPSLPFIINVNSLSFPGTISNASTICLGQPTSVITLSNYSGSIVKWQKRYNSNDWIDINNTTSTFSETPQIAGLYQYRAEVKNETCPSVFSASCSITVDDIPSSGGSISGPTNVCKNQSGLTYTIPTITGALYYQWTLPSGATGISTTNTIIVNYSNNANSGFLKVNGVNNCGNGPESIIMVTVNSLPESAGIISGSDTVCQGTTNVIFTVPTIENATSYIWTLPTGVSGTSSTNSIIANFGTSAVSGNVTVKGHNSCGNGITSSKLITVRTLPSAAGTISGTNNVCIGQDSVVYSISSISNASSYVWTLPTGATGTSTTNSIYVSFGPSAISGNITIKGENPCGNGAISSKMITVKTIPADAGVISGLSNVCQGQTAVIYNVPAIANATSYIWTLPSGATGTSTTNSINVNYSSNAISGDISVVGSNICSNGNSSTKVVNVNPLPGMAGLIFGNETICQGETNITYTVQPIENSTSYVWTLPTGATGSSTTNSITVNFGTSAVSGNITVKGSNSCGYGTSSTKAITVNSLPTAGLSISGIANVCQGQNSITYSIPAITNATSYVWTLPNGAVGTSITNSIVVDFLATATSGNITVKGINSCGEGQPSTKTITVYPLPGSAGIISGNPMVCQGESNLVYSIPTVSNATSYVWTLPIGAIGSSTTNSINVNYGSNALSGNITVKASNSCGFGDLSIKSVSVNHNSTQTINATVCDSYIAPDGQIYTTSGTKIAILPNAEGCDSTITINLTVNETPETPTITQQQYQLISSSTEGNQWYNQNGIIINESNQELWVTETGTYYVIVTQNNCHSEPSNSIYVNYVKVNPYENDYISISPNPFTNQLMIKNQSSEDYKYYMYNSIGQQILQGIIENEVLINTSDLSKGLYIIKFVNSLGQTYYKVIKQ